MPVQLDYVGEWYCCLHPIEREMLIACSNAQAAVSPFILEGVYDAFWMTYGQNAPALRREMFEQTYGIVHATEIVDEVTDVPVVVFDLLFWTPFWLWRFDNPDACDDGCFITNFIGNQ